MKRNGNATQSTALEVKPEWEIVPPRYSVADIEVIAKKAAASRLFGMDEAQTFTLMLIAESEGLHPIQALKRYHVIQGRPAMRADAMLAEFQRQGGTISWGVTTDVECCATFTHPVQAPEGQACRFSLEDAKRAGLTGKDNWQKYPSAMLRARVISMGIRMVLPGVVVGIYTPEEVADFDAPPPRSLPQIEPQPVAAPPPPKPQVKSECYAWIEQQVQAANDHWSATLAIEGKSEHYAVLCKNAWQCINGVVSQWIETGELEADAVTTDGKRDREKIKQLLADAWEEPECLVKSDVQDYLDAKLREAAAAAGVNMDAEPATVTETP